MKWSFKFSYAIETRATYVWVETYFLSTYLLVEKNSVFYPNDKKTTYLVVNQELILVKELLTAQTDHDSLLNNQSPLRVPSAPQMEKLKEETHAEPEKTFCSSAYLIFLSDFYDQIV